MHLFVFECNLVKMISAYLVLLNLNFKLRVIKPRIESLYRNKNNVHNETYAAEDAIGIS